MTSRNKGSTLITGATSDIGSKFAIHRSYLDESLIIHGRSIEKLKALRSVLDPECEVIVWCQDFADLTHVFEGLRLLLESHSVFISRFVHCAGALSILPFRRFDLALTSEIFNINTLSAIEVLRVLSCKPFRLRLQSIVLLSALFAKFGDKGNAIYAASKGALNSLVKSLAVEHPNWRINSLLLGAIRTSMTDHLYKSVRGPATFDRYILGTGTPEDVIPTLDFLLSGSLWMTGQEISLDGGASIN